MERDHQGKFTGGRKPAGMQAQHPPARTNRANPLGTLEEFLEARKTVGQLHREMFAGKSVADRTRERERQPIPTMQPGGQSRR